MSAADEPGRGDRAARFMEPRVWFVLAMVAALSLPAFAIVRPPLLGLPDYSTPSEYTATTAWPYPNFALTVLALAGIARTSIVSADRQPMRRAVVTSALAVIVGHAWYLWWGIFDRTPEEDVLPLLLILGGCVALFTTALMGLRGTAPDADDVDPAAR